MPGAFGGMFLGHTTDPFGERAPSRVQVHTAQFFSGSEAYPSGDPRNDFERYDLLSKGLRANRPTGSPSDYRYLFSAGPFSELAPGEILTLQMAFVIGLGKRGMLINAVNAQRIYNGAWRDVDNDPTTGRNGKETCLFVLDPTEPLIWKDPCDSLSPQQLLIKDTVCLPENYEDNDCNCCTPLYQNNEEAARAGVGDADPLGRDGGAAASWQRTSTRSTIRPFASPPGRRSKGHVEWDNLSELTADPIQRKILFTGYRVWRVEGWHRPVGSTGPSPDDWQLVADISRRPLDGHGLESPSYIRRFLCPPGPPCDGLDSTSLILTGSTIADEDTLWYYPVGRYRYRRHLGAQERDGLLLRRDRLQRLEPIRVNGRVYQELAGRPTATERDAVFPRWQATHRTRVKGIYVVPNPYIRGEQPGGMGPHAQRRRPDRHEARLRRTCPTGGLHGEDLHARRRPGPDAEERRLAGPAMGRSSGI